MTLLPPGFYPCSATCPTRCVFMITIDRLGTRPVCRRCALRLLQNPNKARVFGANLDMLAKMVPYAYVGRARWSWTRPTKNDAPQPAATAAPNPHTSY